LKADTLQLDALQAEAALLAAAAPLIELALAEDIGPGDVTSDSVLPGDLILDGRIIAKKAGVIAGLPVAGAVFRRVDPALRFTARLPDGARVRPGDVVAEVSGPARAMLAAERTALNFLQRLSGIATLTRAFVDAVAGSGATILDTRKTHPGYRVLEKYAVRMGGGQNHRMGLYDMVMIKDNHIDAAGSLSAAVERARAAHPDLPIEVEVRSLDELRQALPLGVDRILLDNMDLEQMRAAVELVGGQTPLEASGGVTLENVAAIAATGVDYISVGALTHSAPALDLSMEADRLSHIAYRLSQIAHRSSHIAHRTLRIAYRLSHIAHRSSHVTRRHLHLARRLSPVASRRLQLAIRDTRGAIRDTRGAIRKARYAIRDTRGTIRDLRAALGNQLVILGHHYQRDEVIEHADFRGDSLQLARDAARCRDARYIVFCGVHFMAETAAILAQPGQTVLMPAVDAGCPLAEKADLPLVEQAWAQLGEVLDVEREVLPLTYVNSAADLKAFCGRHGGAVCTSSNARPLLAWALAQRPRVLFFPDQHLGRNTARAMGIPLDEMLLWDPRLPYGGHSVEALRRARLFLWKGWCYVHQRFRPEHVTWWRERVPDIRIIVHPECPMEVVDLADESGSTAAIIRRVEAAPPGTRWAIGTEWNLVNRLKNGHPEQFIDSLSPEPSICQNMAMTTAEKLLRVLKGLARGELINVVTVPPQVAGEARLALERMLEVSP
jgi:quinolinate synthase